MVNQLARYEVPDAPFASHDAFDRHEARTEQLAPLTFHQIVPYHDVHAAGLVFQRHEHYAGRRPGTLAADHQPPGACPTPASARYASRRWALKLARAPAADSARKSRRSSAARRATSSTEEKG